MSCFKPLTAYRDPVSGTVRIVRASGVWSMELPCNRCIGCKMDHAKMWSIRIGHEAQGWDSNLFVTLDYAPEHLRSWSLEYPDFQGFMRRLRKKLKGVTESPEGGYPIRFFVAGEYGEKFRRPHWHAVLFNTHFPDEESYQNGTFRSSLLESIWGMGNCVIGRVTPASAAYVAGYTQSKSYGREAEAAYKEAVVDIGTGELSDLRPEFCQMSRDPGIGAFWYKKYWGDLFPRDSAVQDGKEFKVPRFYFEKLKGEYPEAAMEIAYERSLRAEAVDPEESSADRRKVREEVAEARVRFFSQRDH